MHPDRRAVVVFHRKIHRSLQVQLFEKRRVLNFLFRGAKHAFQNLLVPQLEMIAARREGHLTRQSRPFAQLCGDQNAPLAIDRDFLRTGDKESLKFLQGQIELPAGPEFRDHRVPFPRRIQLETALARVKEVGNKQPLMAFALEDLAEPRGDADASFFVDRVVESAAEHRGPPYRPTISHRLPPRSSKTVMACEKQATYATTHHDE